MLFIENLEERQKNDKLLPQNWPRTKAKRFLCFNLMASNVKVLFFLTLCSHCNPYGGDVKMNYSYKGTGCCSSSAQSVWAMLAQVKTNPVVPMAGSSICRGRMLFVFLNFPALLNPQDNSPTCSEEDMTQNRKPKWRLWPCSAGQCLSLPGVRQVSGLSGWTYLNKHLRVSSSPRQQRETVEN